MRNFLIISHKIQIKQFTAETQEKKSFKPCPYQFFTEVKRTDATPEGFALCNFQERRIYGENTNQKIFAQKVTRHGTRDYPPKYAAPGYAKPNSII